MHINKWQIMYDFQSHEIDWGIQVMNLGKK